MAGPEVPSKVPAKLLGVELLYHNKSFGKNQTENSDVFGSKVWFWLAKLLSCQALPFWR